MAWNAEDHMAPGARLVHHDGRDYGAAVADAAQKAGERMQEIIDRGREQSTAVVEKLIHEAEARRDYLLPGTEPSWEVDEDGRVVGSWNVKGSHVAANVNDLSLGQLCERLRVPKPFMAGLLADARQRPKGWQEGDRLPDAALQGRDLAQRVLMETAYRWEGKRTMLRTVPDHDDKTILRAVLSDSYAPVDQSAIVQQFLQVCSQVGALPQTGSYFTDERYGLRALRPEVLEPLPNEPVLIGLQMGSSEYGCGSTEVRVLMTRLWCTNCAMGETVLRKVHLGAGLRETNGGLLTFSERTLRLNSAAVVSGMGDAMRSVLSEAGRDRLLAAYRDAAGERIDVQRAATEAAKRGVLLKDDIKPLVSMVENEERVSVLPITADRNSRLRYAQALSWLAQSKPTDTRLLLEAEAGRMMKVAAA